jgi:restriction system protein
MVGQIWAFVKTMKIGDLVAVPLKTQYAVAIGKIISNYEYRKDLEEDIKHTRRVKWIRKDIPRSDFDQDILYSFGAFMTVCQITRNDAENRINKMLESKTPLIKSEQKKFNGDDLDLEEVSRDQIIKYLNSNFKGHDLTRLVENIFQAKGYVTYRAPPGPDGGVDILAGAGPFGFDKPRICIQVKSGEGPVDVDITQRLLGTMQSYKAEQGILVSWGGFKKSAQAEEKNEFFTIRLWDKKRILEEIFSNYEKFTESFKAELPLQRLWTLVYEKDET